MKIQLLFYSLILTLRLAAQCPAPLAGGHAHNDYAKLGRQPLHRALDLGYSSIEVDVYPLDGELKVAHYPLFLKTKSNLEELYLQPAIERWQKDSCFFENEAPLYLMIDIKRQPEEAYRLLQQLCRRYGAYIQRYDSRVGRWTTAPIRLLLSGQVDRATLKRDSLRCMQLDGRLSDLPLGEQPWPYIGRISQRWPYARNLDESERSQLRLWLAQAGTVPLRFWALPQRPALWDELEEMGLSLYHVDRLQRYRRWRLEKMD